MAYELKRIGRQKIRYNDDNNENPLVYQLIIDGVKVTPTSATITVYAPGNTTALLTTQAMTRSGTLLSYAADTTTVASWPVDTGYRARIAVTYGGAVYLDDVYFDVAKHINHPLVGRDQLVDEDRRIVGMEWDGDEDMAGPLTAAYDEMRGDIESRNVDGDKLLENMILDSSRTAQAVKFLALAKIFGAHGMDEDRDYYEQKYKDKMSSALASIQFDTNQDQEEDSEIGTVDNVRLEL